jgi:hypothetical protein
MLPGWSVSVAEGMAFDPVQNQRGALTLVGDGFFGIGRLITPTTAPTVPDERQEPKKPPRKGRQAR